MAKAKTKDKEKKKRWYTILAPEIFNSVEIGETIADSTDSVLKKYINVNLMNITRNIKQQQVNVKLKVTAIKDNKAHTELIGYEVSQAAIKRMIRRSMDRIDDSLVLGTADGKKVRIKPIVLTRGNTTKAVKSALRKALRENLAIEVKKLNYDALIKDIVSNRLQREIAKLLNKIYPVRRCSIRMMHIETRDKKKVTEIKMEEKPKPEKEVEKSEKEK